MSREAQARRGASLRFAGRAAPALLAAFLLSNCAAGDVIKQAETDASIITGSVLESVTHGAEDADAATIRNAVGSADLETLSGTAISWANAGTGSRGEIDSVVEYREKSMLCRRFTASRESFEGVMLYNGDACLRGNGFWWMRSLAAS